MEGVPSTYQTHIRDLEQRIQSFPDDINPQLELMSLYLDLEPQWREHAKEIAQHIERTDVNNQFAKEVLLLPYFHDGKLPRHLLAGDIPSYQTLLKVELRRLREESIELYEDSRVLSEYHREVAQSHGVPTWDESPVVCDGIQAVSEGRFQRVVKGTPCSVRKLAKSILADFLNAVNTATDDLKAFVEWLSQEEKLPQSEVQARAKQRASSLKATLLNSIDWIADFSLMHLEREVFGAIYRNSISLSGLPIHSISREDFWASSDKNAWNLTELYPELIANGGTMLNPLSNQRFVPKDISVLLLHPLGSGLLQERLKQEELIRLIGTMTISSLAGVGEKLSSNVARTDKRLEVTTFVNFTEGLTRDECRALDSVKVVVYDSDLIGSVQSAGGVVSDLGEERVSYQKGGMFLSQIAQHLASKRHVDLNSIAVRSSQTPEEIPQWGSRAGTSFSSRLFGDDFDDSETVVDERY